MSGFGGPPSFSLVPLPQTRGRKIGDGPRGFLLREPPARGSVLLGSVRHIYSLTRLAETTGETGPARGESQVTGFMFQVNGTGCS